MNGIRGKVSDEAGIKQAWGGKQNESRNWLKLKNKLRTKMRAR